MQKPCRRS
uniref:BLTX595 n=1 Tax=Nephila pilipes TaxID=299642 RepID=A0A076L2T8_NEPPI|nr:BLTX595 [Nephila pilipes]